MRALSRVIIRLPSTSKFAGFGQMSTGSHQAGKVSLNPIKWIPFIVFMLYLSGQGESIDPPQSLLSLRVSLQYSYCNIDYDISHAVHIGFTTSTMTTKAI